MVKREHDPANLLPGDDTRTLELAPFDPKTLELEPFDPAVEKSANKSDELIGQVLNKKYAVLDRVGESASIAVYRTLELSTNRQLIAKTLKYREPKAKEWLQARAREQIGKRHPNIVETLDYFETPNGRPFLITEMVVGITLADLLSTNQFIEDEHEIAELVSMIGTALQFAHDNTFYHGNLTPRNVFLFEGDGNFSAKVSDFGIAREFWQNENLPLTQLLDVYQLGLLTYHLSSGRLPYEGKTYAEIMFAPSELEDKDADPLSYHRSDLYCTEQLQEVVEEAIEIGEEWRPEQVAAFLGGIRTWIHGVEGAQIVRSHLVKEIADSPEGQRPLRDPTGERNMRTTIRNMVNLRENLGAQEETLIMKLTSGAAAKGPRRSPLATAGRFFLLTICLVGLAGSIYYISTSHSETVRDLWIKSSTHLSQVLKKDQSEDEQMSEDADVSKSAARPPTASPKDKQGKVHKLAPAFKEPTPKSDPATINAMYSSKKDRFQGNNMRNADQKFRGFRIDYRNFNEDWLKK